MTGGICWYCHWGWSEPVAEIYERAAKDINALLEESALPWSEEPESSWDEVEPISGESALCYGPAHVVWADENWHCAEWCLKECDEPEYNHWLPGVMEIVRRSLRELLALPEDIRDCCPVDYDYQHPENFPPTVPVRKVA